jgi:hypothetical protein
MNSRFLKPSGEIPSYGGGEDHASFRRLMNELMSAEGTIPAVRVSGLTVVRVPAQA